MTTPTPLSFQRVTVGLGTFVAVQAQGALEAAAQNHALDLACEVFQTVERLMHPTTTGSDLSRIASAHGGDVVSVHAWTFEVLSLSLRLWQSSAGQFDPCIPASSANIGDLRLVAPSAVVTPPRPALLDLGGVAKGFAVDKAVDVLIQHGCSAGLVNAGGDMRAFGPLAYEVDLQIPGAGRRMQLQACALAVSAPKSARSPSEHRGFYSRIAGIDLDRKSVV